MTDFSIFAEGFNVTEGAQLRMAKAGSTSSETTVYVDVGSRKISSNVMRDGVPVGIWQMNPDVLDAVITERPRLKVRVVSQSIAPGTPVPLGTSVNLVMAPARNLPVGVVAGTHLDLQEALIGDSYRRLVSENSAVQRIIARAASGNLGVEDETAVRNVFAEAGFEVTDEPGRDVAAAVETLRVLSDFGQ